MGIYVNPGNEEFKRAANSKIYVDKTMLLAFTNQNLKSEHQNICVSRPRRFGKSMAANMLVAYYGKGDDSYELFKSFKFAKDPDFKKHLNQYNAIHLNMQQFLGAYRIRRGYDRTDFQKSGAGTEKGVPTGHIL